MLGINGWEFLILALIAVFVLGPDRMPEYAAKLARGIRQLRVMAENARVQLKDQLGPEYEDINWRQYDPRQYDPRRIVREALVEPLDDLVAPVRDEVGAVRTAAGFGESANGSSAASNGSAPARNAAAAAGATAAAASMVPEPVDPVTASSARVWSGPQTFDPDRPVPYDIEAT